MITISDERPRLAAFGPGLSVEPGHHHSWAATRPGSGIHVLSLPHSRSRTPARSPTCPSDGDTRFHRGRWSSTVERAPRTVDWLPGPRALEGQDGPSPEIGRLRSPLANASRGGARPGVGGGGGERLASTAMVAEAHHLSVVCTLRIDSSRGESDRSTTVLDLGRRRSTLAPSCFGVAAALECFGRGS
jgi:hypothetical protein